MYLGVKQFTFSSDALPSLYHFTKNLIQM